MTRFIMKIRWNAWPVRPIRIRCGKNEEPQRTRVAIRPEQHRGFARRVVRSRVLAPCQSHVFGLMALAALLMTGCAVGPNYSRPTTAAPTSWKESSKPVTPTTLPTNWWNVFKDKELDALQAKAIAENQDLKRAVARVTEARALTRGSKADLYPSLFASGGYSRNRQSENVVNAPRKDFEYDDYRKQLDLSYELDAWGRVRRSIEAARADEAAVDADLQVVLLTLTSDVARHYYSLRSLDREKEVTQATVALRLDAVRLQETRNQAGLINEVDVTRARTELANVEAELHAITRSRAQLEHALAILCGDAPSEFHIAAAPNAAAPPEIPAGLPSALMERRPDVAQAEQQLRAASARIGVAQAAFFPTIKLTSAAGLASADLGMALNWHSRIWSMGPSVYFPIFEGGRNRASLTAAEARYDQTLASYRGTVLNAFREVEDSLSDLSTLTAQGEAVHRALVSARDTAALAEERYQRGLSSYLDVVDAQRAVLQAERTEVQLNGQRNVSTILLAKALGGGWEGNQNEQFTATR
jgi:multidrug efflux system outer membrane protein